MALPASSLPLPPASATLRFLASRRQGPGAYLEARENEPTMEALRWAAEITSLLSGEPVTPAPFIDECRRRDGTFAMTADDPEPSRAACYYAVRALALSDRHGDVPAELPHWFVNELATPDLPAASDIDEMFYVLRALEQLGSLDLLTPGVSRSLIHFIQACRNGDGGYAGIPGRPSDTEHTYCAVCSLSLLRHPLDATESHVTADWLKDRFDTPSGLATLTADDDAPSLAASYWGFRAGEVLNTTVWTDRLGSAVEGLAKADGGYGTRADATLWESYCALRVISRLAAPRGGGR
ncbi:prenyltransferase/squalene oxidase repeat-containing protein [Actinomadura rudentiformis]|uniref:Terpene cyclase/mutase family protein n=1 Tax=Actinomadura rudentiformis TaxID=359158 RepID=A0A6H9YDL9_9ACTN|nr:prenyltransferase/squalene oxidase repeat-containing protein [Actinomadura rudentiformis]KAB2343697.1 terpene cyclase/mutase family protein [Actinomadura rudentiformis]